MESSPYGQRRQETEIESTFEPLSASSMGNIAHARRKALALSIAGLAATLIRFGSPVARRLNGGHRLPSKTDQQPTGDAAWTDLTFDIEAQLNAQKQSPGSA